MWPGNFAICFKRADCFPSFNFEALLLPSDRTSGERKLVRVQAQRKLSPWYVTTSVSSVFVLCSSLGIAQVPLPDSASVFSLPGGRTQPEEGYESSLKPESIFAEQEEIPADAGRRRGVGWGCPRCHRGQGRREGWREGWGHPRWGTWGLPAPAPPGSTLAPRPLLWSLVTRLCPHRQRLLPWALSCAQTKESQYRKFLYVGTGGLFFSLQVQCPGARDRRVRKSHLRLEQIVETSVAVATKTPC